MEMSAVSSSKNESSPSAEIIALLKSRSETFADRLLEAGRVHVAPASISISATSSTRWLWSLSSASRSARPLSAAPIAGCAFRMRRTARGL
eukprot:4385437-Prymnesium_polylepis.1